MGLSLKSLTSSVLLRKSGKKVRENEIRYIEQLVGIYALGTALTLVGLRQSGHRQDIMVKS